MKSVQIELEETSYAALDALARDLALTPAEFAKRATAAAVRHHRARLATKRDIEGYAKLPVSPGEFDTAPEDLKWTDDETW